MLSISQVTSAAAATSYYQKDNYYAKTEQEQQGIWHGIAAQELELAGRAVAPDEFINILSGDIPNGQSLYRVVDGEKKHIPGYDLTFSAPKSVSIMSEVVGSKEMSAAHDKAVTATLDWVEANVLQTRKFNKATQQQDVIGGQKMVAALFKHDISRNEDPQLHTHCVVANAVLGADGKYRSLHSPEIFRNKMLIGAIYRSELAANIELGLLGRINRTHPDGRFELGDMDKALITEFSTRSQDISDYLGEGAHSAEDRAAAALKTRSAKKETARAKLQENWNKRIAQHGYSRSQIKGEISLPSHAVSKIIDKEIALKNSLEHLSENSSTFPRRDVLRFMLSEGLGGLRIQDAEHQVDIALEEGGLKESDDKTLLFTQDTLDLENSTLALEQSGRSTVAPIAARKTIKKTYNGFELSEGQYQASKHILTSPNRTIGIQGYAGTDKTFMLASAAEQAHIAGYDVMGLAPTSNATKTLGDDAKIKSQTLQKFLVTPTGNNKTVLFVDEASLISTNQMKDLLTIAAERNIAKVVLVGDSKQLESAAAGAPFRMLQAEGMRHVVMDDIKRQKKARHLEAVKSASKGDIDRAFKKLGDDIREVALEDLAEKTAYAWIKSASRDKAAIVVTTNALAASVNAHVKDALMAEGVISSNSHDLAVLKSLRLSEMQKRFSDNYHQANFIRFNRSYRRLNISAGETLAVGRVSENGVVELLRNGQTIEFRPHMEAKGKGAFEAFRSEHLKLNEGDKIRWTKPDHSKGVKNMDQAVVSKIDEMGITFKMMDGRTLLYEKDNPQLYFINHAWAQTGHAYQGQTIDHIIAAMPSLSGLTDQKSFYIDISRARDEVTFLTDDVDRLKQTLKDRRGEERSTLDLVREKSIAPKQLDAQLNRNLEKNINPLALKPKLEKRSLGLSL